MTHGATTTTGIVYAKGHVLIEHKTRRLGVLLANFWLQTSFTENNLKCLFNMK